LVRSMRGIAKVVSDLFTCFSCMLLALKLGCLVWQI
jgi:hypothetical protein